jgi:hypothetical protein
MDALVVRFQAKWVPVRMKKTRQDKAIEADSNRLAVLGSTNHERSKLL